jgi:hypothetical protein
VKIKVEVVNNLAQRRTASERGTDCREVTSDGKCKGIRVLVRTRVIAL